MIGESDVMWVYEGLERLKDGEREEGSTALASNCSKAMTNAFFCPTATRFAGPSTYTDLDESCRNSKCSRPRCCDRATLASSGESGELNGVFVEGFRNTFTAKES
jgi:hypothetical protein